MVAYIKLKTNSEELYETSYITNLREKKTIFSKFQYILCYMFYELIVRIKYFANIITIKKLYNAYVFILPCASMKNTRKIKLCMKKIEKLIPKYKIHALVISEEMKKHHVEKYFSQINFLNGKGVMPYLIQETLEYVFSKGGIHAPLEDLYICVNEALPIYLENIAYLLPKFKSVNIVTSRINRFQNFAENLEQKDLGMITVTNNKKKSLKKAKWVINFDFSKEELKKYNIYRRALIICLNDIENYDAMGFDGINIKRVEVDTSQEMKDFWNEHNLLKNYDITTLCESMLEQKKSFLQKKEQLNNVKAKIIKLYGQNGEIEESNYKKTFMLSP